MRRRAMGVEIGRVKFLIWYFVYSGARVCGKYLIKSGGQDRRSQKEMRSDGD